MELRHIRYFLAVAEERNFTRAAARLHVAQSPVSQQIQQLEREIGVRLLDRNTRSVALTYAGTVFYERTRTLITDLEEAAEAARKAARGELGSLAVGFTGSATYELLPMLVRAYTDRHPNVRLEVHTDMATSAQVEGLLDGRLGVGVVRTPCTVPGLVIETVRHEPVGVLLASRHPATVHRELELSDLRDDWFIAYPANPRSSMYTLMEDACAAAGFRPKVRQTVSASAALVALVVADMGISLVPASLRHLKISGATYRPLRSPRLTTALALAYREGTVDPLVRLFLETARTLVRSRDTVEPPVPAQPVEDDRFVIGL